MKQIPLRIWTYWHTESIPPLVEQCIASWKQQTPKAVVTVLHGDGFCRAYLGARDAAVFRALTVQRQSDWVRLRVLSEEGGIWMDATTLLTRALDWVRDLQQKQRSDGVLYYLHGYSDPTAPHPILENWFLASVKGSRFMCAWHRTFVEACRTHGNDGRGYAAALRRTLGEARFGELVQRMGMIDYLTMHVAAQVVLSVQGVPSRMTLLKAEDGPLSLAARAKWNSRAFARAMVVKPAPERLPPILKLRATDRQALEKALAAKSVSVNPRSIYALYLMTSAA